MRLVTGIGILEIVLSRSNLKALLEALDDPDSTSTVLWPLAIERDHWHPKALLDGKPLTLQVTVEDDDGHPDVPFEIQSFSEMAGELGIDIP
jgi:hypothetical protein